MRFFSGSAGVVQAVVRGDVWIASLIDPAVITALADGAPIAAVYPDTGVPAALANVVRASQGAQRGGRQAVRELAAERGGPDRAAGLSGAPGRGPASSRPAGAAQQRAEDHAQLRPLPHARLPAVDAEGVPTIFNVQ